MADLRIRARIGMIPGEKFDGISEDLIGLVVGSHLKISALL